MSESEQEYTVELLGRWVRDVMSESDCSLDDAVQTVHSEIASGDLAEWWHGIGAWAIKEAEKSVLRRGSPRPISPATRRTKSWFEKFKSDPSLVWEMEYPVGARGERKRLGDFTRDDALAVQDMYVKQANTMMFRGEMWGRLAKKMKAHETMDAANLRGAFSRDEIAFLGERSRIDQADAEQETQDVAAD